MNKIYHIKWSTALGAYVVCSEISKRMGKKAASAVVIAAAFMPMSDMVYAQATCGGYSNDVMIGTFTCLAHNATDTSMSANGLLMSPSPANATSRNIYAVNPDITVGSTANRNTYTNAGTAISVGGWDSAAPEGRRNTLTANNVTLYLNGSSAGANSYSGAGAGNGGGVWINNFKMDVANANNGDFNGLIAGLPFGNINPNGSNFKNYVHVANNYNLKVAKSNISNRNPKTGIRAI